MDGGWLLMRMKVGVGCSLRPEGIYLYGRLLDRRIDNDFIYFVIAFHLYGFVIDMLCMQRVEVDNGDRKTYQKLQNGQGIQIPRVNHQTLIVLVLLTGRV